METTPRTPEFLTGKRHVHKVFIMSMRIGLLSLLFVFVAAGCLLPSGEVYPCREDLASICFENVNQLRQSNSLHVVKRSPDLDQLAMQHTLEMIRMRSLSHRSSRGQVLAERLNRARIDWREAGENVARNRGFDQPAVEAVDRWWESPEHRVNILNRNVDETGIGVAVDPATGYVYFTQIFAVRMKQLGQEKESYWRSKMPTMIR